MMSKECCRKTTKTQINEDDDDDDNKPASQHTVGDNEGKLKLG